MSVTKAAPLLPSVMLATMMAATGAVAATSDTPAPDVPGSITVDLEMGYSDFITTASSGGIKTVFLKQGFGDSQTVYFEAPFFDCHDIEQDCAEPVRKIEDFKRLNPEGTTSFRYKVDVPANENLYDRLTPLDVRLGIDGENTYEEIMAAKAKADTELFTRILIPTIILLALAVVGGITSRFWIPPLKSQFNKMRGIQEKKPGGGVMFKDVAGVDEAIEDVEDIVEFLRNPEKFRARGLKVPRGLLLSGPPGNGKTLLAKAIATEAGVPFLSYAGSEFNASMYMGIGTGKIKDMFSEARKKAKKHGACIIFVDEFDTLGRARSGNVPADRGAILDKDNQVNQLLTELDGFDSADHNIVFIVATNRPDMLDPALTRPGRIDKQAHIGMPDMKSREKIINIYLSKQKYDDGINARELSKVTYNFSGAQLAGMINEAGLYAAKQGREKITAADIEYAKDKILLGAEMKSRQFSEEEKNTTAYHEAGHAVVGHRLPESFPIYKATIMPRGKTLGTVHRAPDSDISTQTLARLKADLAVAMAGRVAEELVFGRENITSGAQGDFKMANQIAMAMVYQSGMSSNLKPYFIESAGSGLSNIMSPETLHSMEAEIDALLDEATATANKIITEDWDNFVKVAEALLERETLDAHDIEELLGPNTAHIAAVPNKIRPDLRIAA